jgi:hypothetical protein
VIPLLCVFVLEIYFAVQLDWRSLRGASLRVLTGRLFFSLLVPWVVASSHIKGRITQVNQPNRQNLR